MEETSSILARWWVHELYQQGLVIELVAWIFWVLLSITLHELAHGWTALWQGDDTPNRMDRLTANPLVHMGPHALIMFAVCGIAWGAMPVNPGRFRDGRRGDILVSAAGPAMNLLLGALCLLGLLLWMRLVSEDAEAYRYGVVVLHSGIALNLILAPFNLLPIPPLDGAHILAGFWRRARRWLEHPQAPMIGLFVFAGVFFMSPVGGYLIDAAWSGTDRVVDLAGRPLGNPPIIWAIADEEDREALRELGRMLQDPANRHILHDPEVRRLWEALEPHVAPADPGDG
jgi:Zn-dependent protease